MNGITQAEAGAAAAGTGKAAESQKKSQVNGKTIGNPELSEKAAKYYEQLKKKYSNMDFILVSRDKKDEAQNQAGNYANASKMVVLIDEEKIEKMAEDEKFRSQYEGIISKAASGMSQLKSSIAKTGANVRTYGIKINDNGTASFFAVVDKSLKLQIKRIEKNAKDKKEAKKAEEIKTEKDELLHKYDKNKDVNGEENTVTITASSIEELIRKINDSRYDSLSDQTATEKEKQVGQNIDFRM